MDTVGIDKQARAFWEELSRDANEIFRGDALVYTLSAYHYNKLPKCDCVNKPKRQTGVFKLKKAKVNPARRNNFYAYGPVMTGAVRG